MIPPLIVAQAVEVGLDMIAVSDHNSAENVRAVMKAAEGSPLKVLPGLECESVEGVHIVCIFDRAEDAESMQELVYSSLPDLKNDSKKLGEQMVVTHDAEFVRYNERLLLASTSLEIIDIVQAAEERSGIAFPAHVDRIAYGVYGVLGFLPLDVKFPAVEISKHITEADARAKYPDLKCRAIIRSSDAHVLADIGSARTAFNIERRSGAEIKLAVEGKDGRSVVV